MMTTLGSAGQWLAKELKRASLVKMRLKAKERERAMAKERRKTKLAARGLIAIRNTILNVRTTRPCSMVVENARLETDATISMNWYPAVRNMTLFTSHGKTRKRRYRPARVQRAIKEAKGASKENRIKANPTHQGHSQPTRIGACSAGNAWNALASRVKRVRKSMHQWRKHLGLFPHGRKTRRDKDREQ